MNFSRYGRRITFTFAHLPSLFNYYKKTILTSTGILLISILTMIFEDAKWKENPLGFKIFLILRYGPFVLLILLGLTSLIYFFIKKIKDHGIVIEKILLDGYYYPDYKYNLLERVWCVNEHISPVREILGIKEGYHNKPSSVIASAKVINNSRGHKIKLTDPSIIDQTHTSGGRTITIKKYEWNAVIDPPIKNNEPLNYYIMYSAKDTEHGAFEDSGTVFSRRVFYETLVMVITIHPPCGHLIILLEHTVNDETGKPVDFELKRIEPPIIIDEGSLMRWRILLPYTHYRYGLRYRLKKM